MTYAFRIIEITFPLKHLETNEIFTSGKHFFGELRIAVSVHKQKIPHFVSKCDKKHHYEAVRSDKEKSLHRHLLNVAGMRARKQGTVL